MYVTVGNCKRMSLARGLVRNSTLLFVANLVTRVSSALLLLAVARFRQPEATGVFTLAVSYTLLLEAASQMGLDQLLIRDAARARSEIERVFAQMLTLRIGLLATALLLFAVVMLVGRAYPDTTRLVLILMALVALPDVVVDMCQAFFVVTDKLWWPSLVSIGAGVIRLGLGLLVLGLDGTLAQLAITMLIASSAQMVWNLLLVRQQGIQPRPTVIGVQWRSMLTQALPFGAIQMLVAIEGSLGTVLLSTSVSERMLGYYGVANSMLSALILLPNAIQMAVFPHMTETSYQWPQKLKGLYTRIYRYLVILAGSAVLAVLIGANLLTVTLYRQSFQPSAVILQIMTGVLLVYFLNVPNVRVMVILEKQRRIAEMLAISVSFNVILTLILIPPMGVLSVPIARVASMVSFFLMSQLYVSRRIIRMDRDRTLARAVAGVVASVLITIAVRDLPLWLQMLVGLTSFIIVIIKLGGLPRTERRYLREMLLGRLVGGDMRSD